MSISETRNRPWTVVALVAWLIVGMGSSLVLADRVDLVLVGTILFGGLMALALWNGQEWAFRLAFALNALCGVVVAITLFVTPLAAVIGAVGVGVLFVLLLHPRTKAYAFHDSASAAPAVIAPSETSQLRGPTPLGVRRNTVVALGFLLLAITIAGVFGVIRAWSLASL